MSDIYSAILYEDTVKDIQTRLTVNEFRDIEYLHIRKYYRDFSGEWSPSKEGISMPLDFNNSRNLLQAVIDILSLAESRDIIEAEFGEILRETYTK